MSNIKFTMKDLDGTVMPYTSFVISTSTSANAASFTTNVNGEATVSLAAVSTPYYISKQDGTTESVIAYKFFVPNTTYTLDAELLFADMGKISKDKNDKSIAALIEAKVVAVNAANRALQVVSLLGDVSTIRTNLDSLVQVASNLTNINAVNTNQTNINTVAGNTTNINKVATIDTSVTTVANSQTTVNTVATNIANVNTVAPHTANIGTVAANVTSVSTVSGSIASVNTTANNIASVNTVAGNTSNISTVAGISPAVSTVANNIADIQTTAEGIGLIPDVLPYTSNITTVANNIAPIIAVGNNINNINEVRAMEADIEVLADEIANIAGAAAAVTQAVDAQKVLYVAGTDYTKNTSNTLNLPYFPAKSNSVKIFFDGTYKNKDTWNRVGKNIAFTSVINADQVEIHYEVPSSFVGLSPEDILVVQNAEAAALASEVDAQQSATAAAVSASLAQGVANQAVDAIKQLFVAGTGFTKNVSTQLTMDFTPAKTNAVKVFFDGVYQNKNTFTRLGKVVTFNEAINVDNVEIHYEVPSQFVGLDDYDNAVLVAAQNAAQASANAAAASFDSFDDRYLGAKTVAPTLDNDGNTILVGAKYFNSTESKMYVRNSSNTWQLDTANSSTVGYLPAGTGAVATTVQSALRNLEKQTLRTDTGLAAALHQETSFILLGDSISAGYGLSDYTSGYSYQFMRSLMNASDYGFSQDPGYGYHTIVNMANQLSEPGVTTTGSIVGGGVVGSRLSLAAGQSITITGKEISFLDFVYDGSASTGSLVYTLNGVTIATKTVSGSGLRNTFPTALNASQTSIDFSDTVVVTATGGTVVITGVLPLKDATAKPLMYAVEKSGTAYQDYTNSTALDELAYYLNFARSGKINVIILALGTNNIYSPSKALSPASTVEQIAALISGLESRSGTDIYLVISIPPKATSVWPVALSGYTYEDYVDAISAYAETRFATLVRNDLSLLSRTTAFYSDGVHPNEFGHSIMAQTFCDAIGVTLKPQKPKSVSLAKQSSYTPVVSGFTTAGTGTYTKQAGTYTKIGPLVFFTVEVSWTAHTGTGLMVISLPTNPSISQLQALSVFYDGLAVGAGKQVSAMAFDDGSARMTLTAIDPSTGGYSFIGVDSAVTKLVVGGCYFSQ